MKKARRTRLIDWIGCLAFLAVGGFFLVAGVFTELHGITPESELVEATGVATDGSVSTVAGRYGQTTDYLWFTVGGYRVEYASDQNGYDRLVAAIRSGTPLTIRVSTKRETLLPRRGWVPLYALAIGGDVLLTYQDTTTRGYRASKAPYIVGGVLLALSLFGLFGCFKNRNQPVM